MASKWTDIDTEIEGVRKAARNLKGDPRPLAEYVYDRASAYIGPMHEDVTVALIAAAVEATADPEASP